jgi:hypothetical protein
MLNFNLINFNSELFSLLIPVYGLNLDLNICCLLFLIAGCFLTLVLFFSVSFMETIYEEDEDVLETPTSSKKNKGKGREEDEKLSPILMAQLSSNELRRLQGKFRRSYNHFPENHAGHLSQDQCVKLVSILQSNPISFAEYSFSPNNFRPENFFYKNTHIYPEASVSMISIVRFHEEMQAKK